MTMSLNKTLKTDLLKIDPERIVFDHKNNPREDYGDIKSLMNFIEENGTEGLPPIKVKAFKDDKGTERFNLIHGYRRMTAISRLIEKGVEIKRVIARPVPKGYTDKDELLDHISENSGMKLNAMEEANVFEQLIKYGWSQAEIAKRIGKTQSHVSQVLKLSGSSDYIKDTVAKGLISGALVVKVINENKGDEKAVERILKASVKKLEETGDKKVTKKNLQVNRISKYRKLFNGAYAQLRNKETSAAKLKALKEKVEPIIKMLEESEDTETLAKKLLEIV
jgi:ParB/RepB/Spo0J family partition protein